VAPVLAIGLAAILAQPGLALASSVSANDARTVNFVPNSGETNVVTVSYSAGVVTITDTGASLSAGMNCSQVNSNTATCTAMALAGSLDGGSETNNDSLTIQSVLPGGDQVSGGGGSDTLTGGPGNDFLIGDVLGCSATGAGDDIISGGDGHDAIQGGGGGDTIDGGTGNDTIEAGDGNDTAVTGGVGDDILNGGAGNDSLAGGPGNDTFEGGTVVLCPPTGSDSYSGGDDNDTLLTPATADGGDSFSGGPGVDFADYSKRTNPLSISMDGAPGDGEAGEGDNIGTDVENLTGGAANDVISGNDAANALDSASGEDVISGLGGDDVLSGGTGDAGADTLDGGDGNDTAMGGPGDDALLGQAGADSLDGGSGADSVSGGDGNDNLVGGAGGDSLDGEAGDDLLEGGAPALIGADGADQLKGGPGNDTIKGDAGDDVIDGGEGSDVMSGGDGEDTADYHVRFQNISVSFDGVANDGAALELDNVQPDIEDANGGRFDDTIVGGTGSNAIDAGSGEDYVDPGAGPDSVNGGDDGDILRSRDGDGDQVACGTGPDYVIGDSHDRSNPDCEFVDDGTNPNPTLDKAAIVKPVKGALGLAPTGIKRSVALHERLRIPLGSAIDARHGMVRLRTAAAAAKIKRRQDAMFFDGAFRIARKQGPNGRTDIGLMGGNFAACRSARPAGAAAHAAAAQRSVRRLWGNGRGRFRTRGRYSAATVRGTTWLTEDRCDGTLTRVKKGTVTVRDLVRNRTITIRAGHSYLARAPRHARGR
jgi:Ca2+-binding RTX toxin-like protein